MSRSTAIRGDSAAWPPSSWRPRRLLAQREPSLGRRLYAQLEQPFAGYALQLKREKARLAMAHMLDWHGLCQKALQPYEQHPMWQRNFLVDRYECYEATKDPLREEAQAALRTFLDDEPPPLFDQDAAGASGPAQNEADTSSAVSQDNAP